MDMQQFAGAESKYLKAEDIKGHNIKIKIAAVHLVEFEADDGGKQQKPALELVGKEKQVVCNATSVNEMGQSWGYDSDNWVGKEIGLSTKHYASLGKDGIVITAIKDFVDDDLNDCPF